MLGDGRVVVAGGLGLTLVPFGLKSLDDISIYDPVNGRLTSAWTPKGDVVRLIQGRSSFTMTTLRDDRVLITGGNVNAKGTSTGRATDSVEILSVTTGRIVDGPPMNEPRAYHTATLLSDGRVLVAGGMSWEVFDPKTTTWLPPVKLVRRHSRHAAVWLPATDGEGERVLVIAGVGNGGWSLELLDPVARTSRLLKPTLRQYTNDLAAARMADGRVLIVGGQNVASKDTFSDVLVFDPTDESLRKTTPVPERLHGISDHEMFAVGKYVVVLGGEAEFREVDTELDYLGIFNSETEHWGFVGHMAQAHDDFAAVRLKDDRILVVGGARSEMGYEAPTATVELISLRVIVVGDLDGDGQVTRADVARFVDVLLNPDEADEATYRAADVNGDGKVDVEDIGAFGTRIQK